MKEVLNLGIDDAGRGPVIGPMIIAGCLLNSEDEKELRRLGVRDSKQLTPKRREFLADEIRKRAKTFEIVLTTPNEIESMNEKGIKLNEVEAIKVAKVINKINSGRNKLKVLVDCPSTSILKWTDYLKTKIENLSNLEIKCEHKADRKHVSVSAASILAKSRREKEMDKLKAKYGDEIGSGYPSDPDTIKFLQKNIKKFENDGIFRKTWKTYLNVLGSSSQKKLEF
jgi:ribonuclease HII